MEASGLYKVVIVDDHKLFADSFKSLLEKFPFVSVVRTYTSGKDFLSEFEEIHPDIVFMDVEMPSMNGIQITKRLLKQAPDVKVVAITMSRNAYTVKEMIDAGAVGYATKELDGEKMDKIFDKILKGEKYIMPEAAVQFTMATLDPPSVKDVPGGKSNEVFTSREIQIIRHIRNGLTDKEIGNELNISTKTVEADKRKIMNRFGVKKSTEIVGCAYDAGILP